MPCAAIAVARKSKRYFDDGIPEDFCPWHHSPENHASRTHVRPRAHFGIGRNGRMAAEEDTVSDHRISNDLALAKADNPAEVVSPVLTGQSYSMLLRKRD